ncbi:MAG: response regulator [Gemmataceae bacterium]|nr:response regulator [Gemmataceae bacterium]
MPESAGEAVLVTGSTPRAKILIAEDNPQGAELLEAFLSEGPYETRIATNGEEAVQVVKDWQPDLVLLDIMMPRLSGFEVCRTIRSNPKTRDIGIIMVTALDQHSDIDRAVDVETDDFLTKPIHKAELLLRVKAMLSARSQPSDLERTLEYIRAVEETFAG